MCAALKNKKTQATKNLKSNSHIYTYIIIYVEREKMFL